LKPAKRCPRCGRIFKEDAVFCNIDGTKLVTIDLDTISSVPPTKVYNLSIRFFGVLLVIISGVLLMLSLVSNLPLIYIILFMLGLIFGWFILKKGVKRVD